MEPSLVRGLPLRLYALATAFVFDFTDKSDSALEAEHGSVFRFALRGIFTCRRIDFLLLQAIHSMARTGKFGGRLVCVHVFDHVVFFRLLFGQSPFILANL